MLTICWCAAPSARCRKPSGSSSGCAVGAKALIDGLQRDHRGALALLVATHAVAGDQQRGLVRDLGPDAVLVAVACAPEAEFSVFNAQAVSKSLG